MKAWVDPERCMGHGMCNAFAGELFTLTEDGFNAVGEIEVPEELREVAQRGARACPERAITLLDDDGSH